MHFSKYAVALFFLTCLLRGAVANAQTFSAGTSGMTILSGTPMFLDSLTIVPSANLSITSNSLTRTATAATIYGVTSIGNKFSWGAPLVFSGTLSLRYTSTTLDGNPATELVVAYDGVCGVAYRLNCASTADTANKRITSSVLSAATISEVTAVKSTVSVNAISGASTVNVGATTTLSSTTSGGTWSSTDTSLATISTSGVVSGVGGGTDTILYTVNNTCNAASQMKLMNINANNSWTGTVSNYWGAAGNWSTGIVPNAAINATIPAGTPNDPHVTSGTWQVKNLDISSGAVLTVEDTEDTLKVKGKLTNNGTISGSGTLSMEGTGLQEIAGVGLLNYLRLNNSLGAAIDSGARQTILKTLSIAVGTLATNDSLVLGSDASGSARLAELPSSGAAVSGNVKVNQYMMGGRRAYRFWAHPFSNYISLSQLMNYIDISGPGGATNGFTTTATNVPSAFWYNTYGGNSSIPYDPGWRQFASAYATPDSNRFKQYEGIRVFYRGKKGEGLGFGTYTPSATTVSQWGTLNQGNQDIPLHRGTSTLQDYTMVGNPYASPVDIGTVLFNAASAGRINGAYFWIWNPFLGVAGQFQAIAYTTGGSSPAPIPYYLQANDAFQARALHHGDLLNFTEANKSAGISSPYSLMKAPKEAVALYVYDSNYHLYDMFSLRFDSSATDSEDIKYDGGKPSGAEFNFYSWSANDRKLSVDTRPYRNGGTIRLGITSNYAQEYIIRAENLSIPAGGSLYLHDKWLEKYLKLEQGTEYHFSVTFDKNTQGDQRFELGMKPADSLSAPQYGHLSVTMQPNPTSGDVEVSFHQPLAVDVSISIIDLSGVRVREQQIDARQNGTLKVSLVGLASGVYLVTIKAGKDEIVQRLIKE